MSWVRTYRGGSGDETRRIVLALYEMAGGEPMIDLGCRSAALTVDLKGTWMDIDPQPDSPKGTVVGDIRDAPTIFSAMKKQFNLAILTDVIEHLEKRDGEILLPELTWIAKSVLVFTPIGKLWITDLPGPHTHRSGWYPEEMEQNGFTIWEWPIFHKLNDGNVHGAFFAWKFFNGNSRTVEAVAKLANVSL